MITAATSDDEFHRKARVAVLPVGSFEQHGKHLPLATDTLVACVIAKCVSDRYDLFCLPPITFSCSHEHEGFPGTVSISARTLMSVVSDISHSLQRAGIDRLVLVNGHGGNYVLFNVAQECNVTERRMGLFPSPSDVTGARAAAGMVTTASEDMHGGEWEVSILLHAYPDLVKESYVDADVQVDERPLLHLLGVKGYSTSGIIGKPSAATAEKGGLALAALTESFGGLLQQLELQK
ncbi:creatininase family protein [Actinokineospora sp. NPDC004072]